MSPKCGSVGGVVSAKIFDDAATRTAEVLLNTGLLDLLLCHRPRPRQAAVDLEPDEKSLTAYIGDKRRVQLEQAGTQTFSHLRAVLDQAFLQKRIQRLETDRCGEWVAAKGAAVISRLEQVENFAPSKKQ